jgi:hypothetical protein
VSGLLIPVAAAQASQSVSGAPQWGVESVPIPPGASQSSFNSVSCANATACTAVGFYVNQSNILATLAEGWNGSAWVVEPTPSLIGGTLQSVSCTGPARCVAVGYQYLEGTLSAGYQEGVALAERWNGSTWSILPTPAAGSPSANVFLNELSTVSCTSPTACLAVGGYVNSGGWWQNLAEGWNGESWSLLPSPATGIDQIGFDAVSCATATACTAPGADVWGWNGASWVTESVPAPSGAFSSALTNVSCPTSAACVAAGRATFLYDCVKYEKLPPICKVRQTSLADVWNGTVWTIVPAPGADLTGVSCSSATACIAVGSGTTASWNGTAWTEEPAPPAGISALSCTASPTCTGVGADNGAAEAARYYST